MQEKRRKAASHMVRESDLSIEAEPLLESEGMPAGRPSPRAKGRQSKRTLVVLLCCAVALITLITAYYFVESQRRQAEEIASQLAAEEALRVQQAQEEQERIEYEALVSSNVFAEGITVNDVAIGGMTRDEAKAALTPVVQQLHTLGELQLTLGDKLYSIDLNPMVVSDDLDAVLTEAFALGKQGEYASIKAELASIKSSGRAFTLTPSYDYSVLSTRVSELAAEIDTPMKDAYVSDVNAEERTLTFADEVPGVTVQQDQLIAAITTAMKTGDLTPEPIPVVETKPVVTRAALEAQYVKRASATTDFSSSISARKYNIRKGAGMINATILKPGDVFSTNDVLGVRTSKNGWKNAGAYEGGMVVEQAGGGVCQLSSTLYNAAVKADLEIVSRRNHSMPVAYISEGLDATINSVGNIIDFKFSNNTSNDIVIFAYTVNDKKLTFEIWGVPFPEAYDEIKLSAKKVGSVEPEGVEVITEMPVGTILPDGNLVEPGGTYVIAKRRSGSQYQSYKTYYKNGAEVKSEKLAYSSYKAFTGETWIGPALEVTPAPEGVATPDPFSELPPGAF